MRLSNKVGDEVGPKFASLEGSTATRTILFIGVNE